MFFFVFFFRVREIDFKCNTFDRCSWGFFSFEHLNVCIVFFSPRQLLHRERLLFREVVFDILRKACYLQLMYKRVFYFCVIVANSLLL